MSFDSKVLRLEFLRQSGGGSVASAPFGSNVHHPEYPSADGPVCLSDHLGHLKKPAECPRKKNTWRADSNCGGAAQIQEKGSTLKARMQGSTLEALHEAAEIYWTQVFEDATYLLSFHAKRGTLVRNDMILMRRSRCRNDIINK